MRNKPKESTRTRRTNQIELFCLDYFKTGNATLSARNVGYAPKYADRTASRLMDRPYVIERLKQLRQKAEDDSIATVIERKQILTKVLRTNLTDFMELGADGSWVNLGPETKNAEAIAEIHSRTEYDDDGAHSTVHTSVKLHDKLKAADLLNKMDGIYKPDGAQINIDNRQLTIIVRNQETANLIDQIGERKQLNGD